MWRRLELLVVTLVFLLSPALGCGEDDDGRMKVYPVSGSVLIGGQPAAEALVTFYGATDDLRGPAAPIPFGTTDENGQFKLQSYDPQDGAPAGEFKVTVIWPEPLPPGADEEMYERKDRLGGRYSDPEKSGLTVTVEEGGNELPPFELK